MLKTSRRVAKRHLAVATLATATIALTACAPTDEADSGDDSGSGSSETSGSSSESPSADECTPDTMDTVTDGTLTIATDDPAYEPWFVDNDPTNGEGYESAVAYAIAEQLGYTADQVTWVTVPFNKVVQPGPKEFDFDVNQVSITEARRKAVDFSSGYYDVVQTVVTNAGSSLDGATSLADLADAKLGAQVGTTSYTAITDQVQPSQEPAVFDTNDQAVQALKNGQIDGIVVDLPTAYYMSAVQLDDGVIVGQLPLAGDEVEQFGAVLGKGSPLTGCVSGAVDALREDGILDQINQEWLAQQGAPELS
ncbi:polar amino acid transport system substrate-binding protein [Nocardioides cavernae]|uniref:Polar amino acid transport system substrate-binding protein n=1 Tax=Nocardioides cavernae TaxID=1921566 RepID=A0A7Y9H5U7_9ACTN|nr:ABC transporter substrate-binding protein [Nocardioides cavernae]NYE38452.1 polar amino acid transport system substrate-binding protein [Nocardioides cavernae]